MSSWSAQSQLSPAAAGAREAQHAANWCAEAAVPQAHCGEAGVLYATVPQHVVQVGSQPQPAGPGQQGFAACGGAWPGVAVAGVSLQQQHQHQHQQVVCLEPYLVPLEQGGQHVMPCQPIVLSAPPRPAPAAAGGYPQACGQQAAYLVQQQRQQDGSGSCWLPAHGALVQQVCHAPAGYAHAGLQQQPGAQQLGPVCSMGASLDGSCLSSSSCLSNDSSLALSQHGGWAGHVGGGGQVVLAAPPGLMGAAYGQQQTHHHQQQQQQQQHLAGGGYSSGASTSACGSFGSGGGAVARAGSIGGSGSFVSLLGASCSAGSPSPEGSGLQVLSIGHHRPDDGSSNGSGPLPILLPPQQQQHHHQAPQSAGPPVRASQHKWGIDPRLVVGTPVEVAWEVLQRLPDVTPVLELERDKACLRNMAVQEDPGRESPSAAAAAAAAAAGAAGGGPSSTKPDLQETLDPQALVNEQGLVRSCRGLPARVRDDLIRAARLAVTRRDAGGQEVAGTGLLPFFWRVQANLRWLLRQPATLKGQLLPGQIDFISDEQRAHSFKKTVAQRARLAELAVLLHGMLQVPDEQAPAMAAAAAAAGVAAPPAREAH